MNVLDYKTAALKNIIKPTKDFRICLLSAPAIAELFALPQDQVDKAMEEWKTEFGDGGMYIEKQNGIWHITEELVDDLVSELFDNQLPERAVMMLVALEWGYTALHGDLDRQLAATDLTKYKQLVSVLKELDPRVKAAVDRIIAS